MPTFRNDVNLKRAIESIINQSYKNIELIIIDDNADINWNEKVKKIVSKYDDKIKLILLKNEKNIGSARSRNLGIEHSQGDYITFLDDDDVYLPDKIERQLVYIISERGDVCITDLFLFNENEKLIRKRIHSYLVNENNLLASHLKHHLTGTDTLMFKKEYLKKIGGFDEIDLGDEFYLVLKAILKKGKFVYLSGNYVKAYVHKSGVGMTAGKDKLQGENILFNRKKEYFDLLNTRDVRYIIMRHNLVIASCYLRMKKFHIFMFYILKAFNSSPLDFIKQVINVKKY